MKEGGRKDKGRKEEGMRKRDTQYNRKGIGDKGAIRNGK